jgi:FAD/FMN-containing dehydrogenase
MAAAELLEAEIVTADGAVRTANACTNPDLFWAIKGGGGGSMGVVTKMTLRTRELPDFFGGVFATVKATSDAAFRRLVGQFIGFYGDKLFNPHWGESVGFRPDNTLEITMVFHGLDEALSKSVWQPFLDWVARSPQDYTMATAPRIGSLPAKYWWDADYLRKNLPDLVVSDPRSGAPKTHVWYAGDQGQVGMYWHGYESLWIPASLLEGEQQKLLEEALFAGSRHWKVALHFNKGLAGSPPEAIAAAKDTAMNPAVLSAFALAIVAGGGPPVYPGIGHEPDLTAARENANKISKSMSELRKVVPQAASYVSESNFFEQSWQQSYWGANYSKLRAVKAKYDPTGLFFVHNGVGSEEWSPDGFTRLT